jgi:heterotetrameric sarcosine oxidase gamma subunit
MIEFPPTVNHIDLNKFQNNKNISISEVRFKHYFNIKFDRNIIYDNKSKLEVDGLIIPNINNKITHYDNDKLIWISPYEWIYISESNKFQNICKKPKYTYIDDYKSIFDLSSSYTTIKLSGENFINVLSKLTSLDILKNINSDYCAQSLVSNIKTIIWANNIQKEIFLTLNRSYSQHLLETILDSSLEYI